MRVQHNLCQFKLICRAGSNMVVSTANFQHAQHASHPHLKAKDVQYVAASQQKLLRKQPSGTSKVSRFHMLTSSFLLMQNTLLAHVLLSVAHPDTDMRLEKAHSKPNPGSHFQQLPISKQGGCS